MQFFILLLGALLFTFYQFKQQPIFFNASQQEKLLVSSKKDSALLLEKQFVIVNNEKQKALQNFKVNEEEAKQQIQQLNIESDALRKQYKGLIKSSEIKGDDNDTNYIFLRFVVDYLPKGLVGLLIAIIFLAAWGSIAAALNSLASCTMIDFHKRFSKKNKLKTNDQEDASDYKISKLYTLGWGIFCVITAQFASGMGSLIEAVNVLGSLFYGVILGIFLVGFYLKKIQGNAVFLAAIIGEIIVITIFILDKIGVIGLGFLWLNVIGALVVVLFSLLFQLFMPKSKLINS